MARASILQPLGLQVKVPGNLLPILDLMLASSCLHLDISGDSNIGSYFSTSSTDVALKLLHPIKMLSFRLCNPLCHADELQKYMHYDAAASKAMGVFPSPKRFQLAAALGQASSSKKDSDFSLFSILDKTCTAMGSRRLKGCAASGSNTYLVCSVQSKSNGGRSLATVLHACLLLVTEGEDKMRCRPLFVDIQVVTTPPSGCGRDKSAAENGLHFV